MSLHLEASSDVRQLVDRMLNDALRRRASDIHVEPTATGYELRYRIDGLLQTVARHDLETGRACVGRLMVLAQLLTYRLDVPQEGRISFAPDGWTQPPLNLRIAIIPTSQGLRAAVRMPADLMQPSDIDHLGLPDAVVGALKRFSRMDSGMLVVTGPAGSGKTTTIYALLRHIIQTQSGLSIVTLEDPVEREVPGVTQIEVKPFGELTYERALRSILRQDPQVLMLGEIRDAATASLALQAALSGHRLICTLHASDPAGAVSRLIEMGMEPYQITSAIFGVVSQRLLRRKSASGYEGRIPVAEFIELDESLRKGILARSDASRIRSIYAAQPGFTPLRSAADGLASKGLTDASEIQRIFGDAQ